MMDSNDDQGFPFPIPISSAMPMNQQMSMNSLYPGSNTQPIGGPSYNFSMPQYSHGGHTGLGQIAEHLRRQGEDEDEILAYINPEEAYELHERFGSDINPHTGLPQFGLFKKIKKALKPINKILPIAGSVLGNYIKPGLGGILGGGLGGALGGKRPLKGALTGAAIGGIQGYGLPAAGKFLSNRGMPNLGRGLTELGQSKLLSGAESLGQGLGLIPLASQAMKGKFGNRGTPWDSSPIAQALSGIGQQQGEQGGLGSILNYLLLGLAGAGMVGGRTTYGNSKQYAKEPSLQEIMKSMRIEEPQTTRRENAPYVPPTAHMQVPDVYGRQIDNGYQYPDFPRFSKGGSVSNVDRNQKNIEQAKAKREENRKIEEKKRQDLRKKGDEARAKKAVLYAEKHLPKPIVPPVHSPSKTVPQPVTSKASPLGVPNVQKPVIPSIPPKASTVPSPAFLPVSSNSSSIPTPEFQNILEPLRLLIEHGKQIAEGKSHQNVQYQQMPNIPQMPIPQQPTPIQMQVPARSNEPYVPSSQLLQVPNVYGSQRNEGYQYPQFPGSENQSSQSGEQDYQYPQFPGNQNSSQQYNDEGYQYPQFPTFKTGGFIDGVSGGQDDDVPVDLPVNGYVIDATTVSSLGDGNTKAGVKRLDELKKTLSLPKKFAEGKNVKPIQKGTVKALVSPGEYYYTPEEVTALGKGDNAKGAQKMKSMVQKIRKHKGFKGLPPKAKPITSYISK
jgi:hypothetical protein